MRKLVPLGLIVTLAACQLQRPGEVRPQRIPGCETVSTRAYAPETLSDHELAVLAYCRAAQTAEMARATEANTDFTADMTYLSLVVGAMTAALSLIIAASSGS